MMQEGCWGAWRRGGLADGGCPWQLGGGRGGDLAEFRGAPWHPHRSPPNTPAPPSPGAPLFMGASHTPYHPSATAAAPYCGRPCLGSHHVWCAPSLTVRQGAGTHPCAHQVFTHLRSTTCPPRLQACAIAITQPPPGRTAPPATPPAPGTPFTRGAPFCCGALPGWRAPVTTQVRCDH